MVPSARMHIRVQRTRHCNERIHTTLDPLSIYTRIAEEREKVLHGGQGGSMGDRAGVPCMRYHV